MVHARDFCRLFGALPGLVGELVVEVDFLVVVDDAELGAGGAVSLVGDGVAVGEADGDALGAEGDAGGVVGVVEEEQAGFAAGFDFDIDFYGVGVAADGGGEDGGVFEGFAPGRELEEASAGLEALCVVFMPEAPLEAEFRRFKAVGGVGEWVLGVSCDGHGDGGVGGNFRLGAKPAVGGPFDGQEKELATEGAVAVLVAVDGEVPVAGWGVDQAAVAEAEPAVVAGLGVDDGVVGGPLPGAVGVAAAGADDGVAGGGSAGAAFGDVEVEIAIVFEEFGGFEAGAFHARGGGDGPGLEDFARGGFGGEAVGGEFDHLAAVGVEEATAVFGDVGGVDSGDAEVDGFRPGAGRVGGVDDEDVAVAGVIDVEVALVFAEIGGPDAAVELVQGSGYGTPVDEIERVPDEQAWSVFEAGVGEVEVVADADGAGVGVVSAEDRVVIDGGGLLGVGEGKAGLKREGKRCGGDALYESTAGNHGWT